MKKFSFIALTLLLSFAFSLSFAQELNPKIILLISEQNIEGPQNAWWISEIDLSITEAVIAKRLIAEGYGVLEPSGLTKVIQGNRALRVVDLSEAQSVELGSLSKAEYVVTGKAVASSGGNVPQSKLRSCFANITAKLIRVKDGGVIAYLDASGNSAHLDIVTGGKEALVSAGEDLTTKLIEALNKEKGEKKEGDR